jgi:methionyl-tRNA formyltransferase
MPFRALFFGTPEFAVPCLDALGDVAEVVGVVCQPDRPAGRGLVVAPPPVKRRAEALSLPVVQPDKVRTPEFAAWVREQRADVALVVAYGRILPREVLSAPRLGCVNVHASLLPRWRGAAPITWAIVHGDARTGITLMQMDEGMDTGPMLEQWPIDIGEDETAGELAGRLASLGALAVRKGLPKYVRGEYVPTPQDGNLATLAPILEKAHGKLDFAKTARAVHDHVRGMSPWPGAHTTLGGKRVAIHRTRMALASRSAAPGTVILADKSAVIVACGEGAVELVEVQLAGKKPMAATEWHKGRGVREGDVLGI